MPEKLPYIYFDAGHGGSDPGAVKYVKEAEVAIKVVRYACAYLKKYYLCNYYMDISADSTTVIARRANAKDADIFISVHFNAGEGDGYEALIYGPANRKMALHFERYVKAAGQNSRGVKYRPDLNVLKSTNMAAILNEIAFVDNKADISDWDEDKELKRMGEQLAKAAATWVGAKKKSASPAESVMRIETKMKLNRRTGPAEKYKKLGVRSKGIPLDIFEVSEDGKWGYVNDKYPGWICITSKYVTKL